MDLIDKILVGLLGQELLDKIWNYKWFDMFIKIIEIIGGICIIYVGIIKLSNWPVNDIPTDTIFDLILIWLVINFGLEAISSRRNFNKDKPEECDE